MSREEAIEILDNLIGMIEDNHNSDYDTAFKMAIQALQEPSGDAVSRQAVMDCFKKWQPYMATRLHEFEKELSELPSVAIPPEHDGCKDCKYETYPDYYYPCCSCKQNYEDEWQKKPHWIMKHRTINEVKYHTGLDDMGEEHTIKELIRYEVDEPYCSECGMKAGDTSQNYCCFCGTKMGGEQDG